MADAASMLFSAGAVAAGAAFVFFCVRWDFIAMTERRLKDRKERRSKSRGVACVIGVIILGCLLSGKAGVKASAGPDPLPDDLVLSIDWQGTEKIADAPLSCSQANLETDTDLSDIRGKDNEIFVKEKGGMQVSLTGSEPDPEALRIRVFYRQTRDVDQWEDVTGREELFDMNWNIPRENRLACYITFTEEGHYRVEISYRENSGRGVTASEESAGCMEGEVYKSPVITLDTTPPELSCRILPGSSEKDRSERSCYREKPVWKIRVREENFHRNFLNICVLVTDAEGKRLDVPDNYLSDQVEWHSFYEEGVRWNEAGIVIEEEGNHLLTVKAEDAAGNQSDTGSEKVTYDKTPPVIHFEKSGSGEGLPVLCSTDPVRFFPYRDYNYFTKGEMKIRIRAEDRVSGVSRLSYSLPVRDDEKPFLEEKTVKKAEAVYILTVPGGKDVRRYLIAEAEDACGNRSPLYRGGGMVSESEKIHQAHSHMKVDLPDPVRRDEEKGILYYNSDICLEGSFGDDYSGIRAVGMGAGRDREAWEKKTEKTEETAGNIIKKDSLKMYLNASEWEDSCDKRPVFVKAFLEDNAGHRDVVPYPYRLVIDRACPRISVTYDNLEVQNGHYYKRPRSAIVLIKDKNPDLKSLKWNIKGNSEGYSTGSFEKTKEGYRCRVYFFGDGENYRLGLSLSDLAGNRASYEDETPFTIDTKPPLITMRMDRSDVRNGKYFNRKKDLTIVIKDRNVPAGNIKWKQVCRKEEGRVKAPLPSLVSDVPGTAIYRVHMEEDASYNVEVSCTDLAGNRSERVSSGEFVIDTKPPALSVTGVGNGEICTDRLWPAVCFRDDHLDPDSLRTVICDGAGKPVGRRICAPVSRSVPGFVRISWEGFPIKEMCDGIYEVHAQGRDLAGNVCRVKKPVRFTIDRFGASYRPDEKSAAFLASYYHKEGQDLVINEVSPVCPETEIVLVRDNESRIPLREGTDYKKISNLITEEEKQGWAKNTYSLPAGLFRTEGVYRILLVSRVFRQDEGSTDKKEPIQQTSSEDRNLKIQFAIDKRPPAVTFSGLEQNEYREKVHRAGVAVLDNFSLDYLEITITEGLIRKHVKKIRIGPEDLDRKNMYYFNIPEGRSVRKISYEAGDCAGNLVRSSDKGDDCSVLVTTNLLVRLMNRKLLLFSACGLLVLFSGTAVFFIGRKRKAQTSPSLF